MHKDFIWTSVSSPDTVMQFGLNARPVIVPSSFLLLPLGSTGIIPKIFQLL